MGAHGIKIEYRQSFDRQHSLIELIIVDTYLTDNKNNNNNNNNYNNNFFKESGIQEYEILFFLTCFLFNIRNGFVMTLFKTLDCLQELLTASQPQGMYLRNRY